MKVPPLRKLATFLVAFNAILATEGKTMCTSKYASQTINIELYLGNLHIR